MILYVGKFYFCLNIWRNKISVKPPIDIQDKVDQIIESYTIGEAIVKLNGFFRDFFWDRYLRKEIARLYLEKRDYKKAVKFLYFIVYSIDEHEKVIKAFEENCGYNYFEIWKQTVVKSKTPRGNW